MVGHHLFVFNCFGLSMILSILISIHTHLCSNQNVYVDIDMYKCYPCLIYSNDNMYYTNDDMIPEPPITEPGTTNSTFPVAL